MVKIRRGSLYISLFIVSVLGGCFNVPETLKKPTDHEIDNLVDAVRELGTVNITPPEPNAKMLDYLRFAINSSPEIFVVLMLRFLKRALR